MRCRSLTISAIVFWAVSLLPGVLSAQISRADYERSATLRNQLQPLALNLPERPTWIGKTNRFWYRKSVSGGFEFVVVDAATLTKRPAFNAEKLASALTEASKEKVDPRKLPFQTISFLDGEKAIQFDVENVRWKCDLTSYAVTRAGTPERRGFGAGRDPMSVWVRGPAPQAASAEAKSSPDGKWEAFIRQYNVWLRAKDRKEEFALSQDGTEGDYYTHASLAWSPDSKKLAAYRLRRGYHRIIQYVQSSPLDQLQPKYPSMEYAKPGDSLDPK